MALVLADRVLETSTTSGTGALTLLGAVNGYQSFANGVGSGNTCYYTIYDTVAYTWEVGVGTYTSGSPNTLTRTTVLSNSSQTTAFISFAGNLMNVWVDYPSEKAIYQDASGNTYVPNLGGTTASTGTFTTITGQTETLKGTGENFVLYSQAFSGNWTTSNASLTANATTAPDSSNTATLLYNNSSNSTHYLYGNGNFALSANATYTFSVYLKSQNLSYASIQGDGANGYLGAVSTFNLSNGTVVSTGSGVTSATITSAGNGWYRCVCVSSASASASNAKVAIFLNNGTSTTYTGDGSSGIYVWGVQVEFGSVANTYVPTTTSAIYGTPTLSFSGVSTIGLQNDGSLFVQPAGTGALQAQQTTSTSTGGNARGANAVDWQTSRNSASQVASASQSVIGGGLNNTVAGVQSVIAGGAGNTINYSNQFIGGGINNTVGSSPAASSSVLGGQSNVVNGGFSAITSGHLNTANGYLNLIGGGESNTTGATGTVTTQATTTVTSGSTAVTLSGSNASIKVGQIVTGTGIVFASNSAPFTYVAAISGTSLTLSQNANASGSPTLSFYTPHGVVVGGGNNQATGAYSVIVGGGDAGTAGNRNVASGDWSFVGGGIGNVASGAYSAVVGGHNTASGNGSFVGGGGLNSSGSPTFANTASGLDSAVVGGEGNQATANWTISAGGLLNIANSNCSSIIGGSYGTTRSIDGNLVFPAQNQIFSSAGQIQSSLLILGVQTTDATATVLRSNTSAASGTNQVILPNNSAYYFKGSIIANVTGAADGAAWSFEGAIMRGANAASTVLIGTPSITRVAVANGSGGSSSWVIALSADTTNGGLAVTVTGVASTTIRWVAKVETTEVTY